MSKDKTGITVETVTAVMQVVLALVGAVFVFIESRRHGEERIEHAWELLVHASGQTSPAARVALTALAKDGQDLSAVKLDEMALSGLSLKNVRLKGARFDKADLDGAEIDGHMEAAGFRCARVNNLRLTNSDEADADVRGAYWDNAPATVALAWKGKLLASSPEDIEALQKTFNRALPGELAVARALKGKPGVESADRLPDCLFDRLRGFGVSQDDLCDSDKHILWDGGWCGNQTK